MNAIDRYRMRREKRLSERYRNEKNANKRNNLFLAILAVRCDEKTRNSEKNLAKSYQKWYNKDGKRTRMDDGEKESDIEWITLKNGAHVPLKDDVAVGGPVEGETFSHAESEQPDPDSKKKSSSSKKGSSSKSKSSSTSSSESETSGGKSKSKPASTTARKKSSSSKETKSGETKTNMVTPETIKEELKEAESGNNNSNQSGSSDNSTPQTSGSSQTGSGNKSNSSYVPDYNPDHFAIKTPEAIALWNRIKSGDYLTQEEMAASPVMQQLDAESAKWSQKYGDTSEIDTPERNQLRTDIKDNFLKAGSAVKDENGNYSFTGEITKGFEAEIVIGLPASGKSTTIANPDSEAMGAFIFDSDEIKTRIPEFRDTGGAAANSVHNESKIILENAFSEFQTGGSRNGDNLVIPVIGDDYDSLMRKWIKPLEASGYKIKVKYKDTDPTVSLNRNIARAIDSGRIIPSSVSLGYGNKPKDVYERFVKEGKYA